MKRKRRGRSYAKRAAEINRIYELHAKSGLPNREIWLRYVYPVYGICERTFYRILSHPVTPPSDSQWVGFLFPDFMKESEDEHRRPDYFKKNPE